uniref:Uncharacterized protein n=1 Tax=Rhipicephalus appendiculatus TaxID=34631 RepID=A0A131YBM2_RHIAP
MVGKHSSSKLREHVVLSDVFATVFPLLASSVDLSLISIPPLLVRLLPPFSRLGFLGLDFTSSACADFSHSMARSELMLCARKQVLQTKAAGIAAQA